MQQRLLTLFRRRTRYAKGDRIHWNPLPSRAPLTAEKCKILRNHVPRLVTTLSFQMPLQLALKVPTSLLVTKAR